MSRLLELMYRRAEGAGVPAHASIELLAPCNLRCPHCYVTHSKRNRLTLPVLTRLFDEMRAAGTFGLGLTGGEVALRKDFMEILQEAKARHFSIRVLSSGTLWTRADWDRLADVGVSEVQLSVYAADACTHDVATFSPGSFDKTLATAVGLLERGVAVRFATPVLKANAHAVGDVADLAASLGASFAADAHITWTDHADPRSAETRATFDQLVAVYRDARVNRHAYPDDLCAPRDDESPCRTGNLVFIQCTGEMYPCVNWPESGGNVIDGGYLDIFTNSAAFRRARGVRYADFTGCRSCGDRASCSPCAAMNLTEHGDIGSPSESVCTATAALVTAERGTSQHPRLAELRGRRAGHRALPIVA